MGCRAMRYMVFEAMVSKLYAATKRNQGCIRYLLLQAMLCGGSNGPGTPSPLLPRGVIIAGVAVMRLAWQSPARSWL
jgi:hypothetical protein